ncbi:tRNA methyltransferase 10 homolog C [Salminus brasiliensis]|uniref:tRNA methyltransferase 10 homolog C n=1 Tax=Salminus brasiliensis TaxID=930266 RepID=UPI003B8390C2
MMSLRSHVVGVLRRCCRRCPEASAAVKFRYSGLPTSSFTSTPLSALTTSRSLSTGWTLRKDAPQSKDVEARPELDLDAWKSVMRSQALQDERHEDEGEDEDKGPIPEEDGELSPLEASRRLVETWRMAGRSVPEVITDEQLKILSECPSKSSKKKYLKHLFLKEGYKKADRMKKEKRMAERVAMLKEKADGGCDGGDGEREGLPQLKNTYLMKFWDRSMETLLCWRAAQAMQHGQPLVFDMSFDQHMTRKGLENTVSQLLESEGWNRRDEDPFHLHFCNLQPNGAYLPELVKRCGQESWERLLITATSQQHIDVFPHDQLVYLTADSPNILHTFDHSKVYVIGAFVDHSVMPGVSLAKAKRLKLATARLPLDEYLHWDKGGKNLTLNQMIQILMKVRDTGSWEKALEFVPKRKHLGFYQQTGKRNVQSRAFKTTYERPQKDRVPLFVSKPRQKN